MYPDASSSSCLSLSSSSPKVGVSVQDEGLLAGNGGGPSGKYGLNGNGGYIWSGADGLLSSISVSFNDLFVPSLLSRHQLASRLFCSSSSSTGVSLISGRGGACFFSFSLCLMLDYAMCLHIAGFCLHIFAFRKCFLG